ncbi:sugar dehydrogenase [Leucothrix sargassi]|nr:sugar dehydrogenase [Leucothrix sargassi]
MKYFLSLILFLLSASIFAKSYPTSDALCDGYPQANIGTLEGICVGVVAQKSQSIPWVKPRKVVQVTGTNQFIITDMGGWTRGKGVVWLLDVGQLHVKATPLLTDLNLPHGLAIGPKGLFYVGEADKIFRFKLHNGKATEVETIVSNLPDSTTHSHPLSHFIFDQDHHLIVNLGAKSDQCKEDIKKGACSSLTDDLDTHAALRRYYYIEAANLWSTEYDVIATGLRNSMALASHKSGTLLQAENSIDLPDLHAPYEEINFIEDQRFYGWPYCYDNKKINPLWQEKGDSICADKEKHTQPWVVLPAHAAPLDMLYYNGEMFTSLKGKLLLSWHGYRQTGHRLVAYDVDEQGRPIHAKDAYYHTDIAENFSKNEFSVKTPFPKEISNVAQGVEIISGLNAIPDYRPMGRPAGITVTDDGAIWLVDDVNKALLRIAKGTVNKEDRAEHVETEIKDTSLSKFFINIDNQDVKRVLTQHCQACHDLSETNSGITIPKTWLVKNQDKTLIEERVFDSPMRPMPPNSTLSIEEASTIRKWLEAM